MMNGSGVIEKLLGGILYQFNVMIANLIIEDTSSEKLEFVNIDPIPSNLISFENVAIRIFKWSLSLQTDMRKFLDIKYGRNFSLMGNLFERWSIKYNKVANINYMNINELVGLSKLSSMELQDFSSKKENEETKFDMMFFADIFTNIMTTAPTGYEKYIDKNHDLNGEISLLNLKKQIKLQNISENEIENFLKQNKDKYHNPYKLEPMKWDSAKKEIYFIGRYKVNGTLRKSVNINFDD
jgi:hypothetical protein